MIMNPEDLLLAVLAGDLSEVGEVSPEEAEANFCCWSTSVVMLIALKKSLFFLTSSPSCVNVSSDPMVMIC